MGKGRVARNETWGDQRGWDRGLCFLRPGRKGFSVNSEEEALEHEKVKRLRAIAVTDRSKSNDLGRAASLENNTQSGGEKRSPDQGCG